MISVVIPVLNEALQIDDALAALESQATPHEVIVVDGGSGDRTAEFAARRGVRVLQAAAGRGAQMNAGAGVASGDILLFLHADTRLPAGGLAAVAAAVDELGAGSGGFLKQYQGGNALLTAVGAVLNGVRTRWFRALVGTQAMFVRRDLFESLDGFREWAFLEDVDLSDRLRRGPQPVAVIPLAVRASARRYTQRGTVHQILVNAIVLSLFRLGVGPERLARLYAGIGRRNRGDDSPAATMGDDQ